MIVLYFVLWIIATGIVVLFCKEYLFPLIKRKFIFLLFSYKIKRMAKRQKDPEAKKNLEMISKGLMDLVKNKEEE